jgi:C4-dicarboxylate-specific signal transduction histidine kinase
MSRFVAPRWCWRRVVKVLVVEDEQRWARFLARVLSEEGLAVDLCACGVDAIEPFFRLAADRADGMGTGLGLAIGRSIARAHGGDLWVDDCSLGARFVVYLPLSGPTTGTCAA